MSTSSPRGSIDGPVLEHSVPKRRYELGRSPDLAVPMFIFLGLPGLVIVGAVISGLISVAV